MTGRDFSRRATTPELMDTDCASFEDYAGCLADLERVNRVTQTHRPTLGFLNRLRRARRLPTNRAVRILDVASGHGDLLRRIDRWATAHQVPVALTGVDLNPWAVRAAVAATPADRPITWLTENVFALAADQTPDIVVSSQFSHHLGDGEIVAFLRWMEARAGLAWLIVDLERHPLPYHFFRLMAWTARWHRFVRHDGPVSILRGMTRAEWQARIAEAGFPAGAVQIRSVPPFRFAIERVKP